VEQVERNDVVLFSESAGRFIVTIDPGNRENFEEFFKDLACVCIGSVTKASDLIIKGLDGSILVDLAVEELKSAWKQPFGDLV
jgi:phosphoribosylformylglycinamidine synthase